MTLFLLQKNNCNRAFFDIYYGLPEQKLLQGDLMVTNYDISLGQKKLLLFPEMRVMKKIFTWAAARIKNLYYFPILFFKSI